MKKTFFRIRQRDDKQWCYVEENDLKDSAFDWVYGMTPGEGIEIEPVEMTQEEFNKLPEFQG